VYFAVLPINFISADVILYLRYSIIAQVSYPYSTVCNDILCIFSFNLFLDWRGFRFFQYFPFCGEILIH
jgi:hypothetical protein